MPGRAEKGYRAQEKTFLCLKLGLCLKSMIYDEMCDTVKLNETGQGMIGFNANTSHLKQLFKFQFPGAGTDLSTIIFFNLV